MNNKSILIVDEDYQDLHHVAIKLVGNQFRLIVSDNVSEVLNFFIMREIPNIVFLSYSIKDRIKLIRAIKKNSSSTLVIPIFRIDESKKQHDKCVIKPYNENDFLEIINSLEFDT